LKQVISEACSTGKSYKFTTTLSHKLAKFVNEQEQHRKTHPNLVVLDQMKRITKQPQEEGSET